MKLSSFPFAAGVAGLILVLSCGMRLQTVRADDGAAQDMGYIDPNADYSGLTQPEALRLAYEVLYPGNHNYNKHRVRAMNEIRQAAEILNVKLEGDGKGHEDQNVSDAQIHLTQRLLDQVRSRVSGDDQQPILDHVNKAMHELSLALEIRAVENQPAP